MSASEYLTSDAQHLRRLYGARSVTHEQRTGNLHGRRCADQGRFKSELKKVSCPVLDVGDGTYGPQTSRLVRRS